METEKIEIIANALAPVENDEAFDVLLRLLSIQNEKIKKLRLASEKEKNLQDKLSECETQRLKAIEDLEECKQKLTECETKLEGSERLRGEGELKLSELIKEKEELMNQEKQNTKKALESLLQGILADLFSVKERLNNLQFKQYFQEALEQLSQDLEEGFEPGKMLVPSGSMTRLCSVYWWISNNEATEIFGDDYPVICCSYGHISVILKLLEVHGYNIQCPSGSFAENIPHYIAYHEARSRCSKLFNYPIPENAMCEIKKLAVNGNNGTCMYN